jgi:hypothetical protein
MEEGTIDEEGWGGLEVKIYLEGEELHRWFAVSQSDRRRRNCPRMAHGLDFDLSGVTPAHPTTPVVINAKRVIFKVTLFTR